MTPHHLQILPNKVIIFCYGGGAFSKTDDDDVDLDDPSNQLIEKLGHDQSLTICSHIDLRDDDDDTYHNIIMGNALFLWTMSETHPTQGLFTWGGVGVVKLVIFYSA